MRHHGVVDHKGRPELYSAASGLPKPPKGVSALRVTIPHATTIERVALELSPWWLGWGTSDGRPS
jgi:hypothetical protein